MMRTRLKPGMWPVVAAGLLAALCVSAGTARAFGVEGVGGKLGYCSPQDLDGTAMMGVHADLSQNGTHFHLLPNVTYWNVDGVRDVAPNLDAYYHFQPERKVSPYLGAGVGVNVIHDNRVDRSNTDAGVNLLGGVQFPTATRHYFVEGRYTVSDLHQVSVLTGFTFHAP